MKYCVPEIHVGEDADHEYEYRVNCGRVLENFPYYAEDYRYRECVVPLIPEGKTRQTLFLEANTKYSELDDSEPALRSYLELKYPPTFFCDKKNLSLMFPFYGPSAAYLTCTLPVKYAREVVRDQLNWNMNRMMHMFEPSFGKYEKEKTKMSFDPCMLMDAYWANKRLCKTFEEVSGLKIINPADELTKVVTITMETLQKLKDEKKQLAQPGTVQQQFLKTLSDGYFAGKNAAHQLSYAFLTAQNHIRN